MSGQIFISYRREDASSCHDGHRFAFWKELPPQMLVTVDTSDSPVKLMAVF
jgi:hypothetical protein